MRTDEGRALDRRRYRAQKRDVYFEKCNIGSKTTSNLLASISIQKRRHSVEKSIGRSIT